MREIGIGVPRRDRLPLLGHPEAAAHRARRLGADRAARRSAAPRHAAPAAVEERERDAVLGRHARDGFLRPVERPVRREVSAVLVAVGIADHHHLLAAALAQVRAVRVEREQLGQDARGRVEVVERLEERHDVRRRGAAGPSRQQEHGQHVGGAARHRDDERTERLRPVEAPHAREEAEEPPGLGARLGRDRGHGQVGRRGRLLRQQAQEHRGAVGVVALREARVDAERIEHAAERGGEAPRVLADVQARGVQPEDRRLDAHRVQVIGGDLARDRSRDHVEHLLDGLDRDARPVRRLVEQPGRHVLLRRRLEVGREQRQREAIGLAAVAPLEIGHVRRQGSARVRARR